MSPVTDAAEPLERTHAPSEKRTRRRCAEHPRADLSPSVKTGPAFARATRVTFKKDKGGTFVGRDTDGTEVMVSFNGHAGATVCPAIEPDE